MQIVRQQIWRHRERVKRRTATFVLTVSNCSLLNVSITVLEVSQLTTRDPGKLFLCLMETRSPREQTKQSFLIDEVFHFLHIKEV